MHIWYVHNHLQKHTDIQIGTLAYSVHTCITYTHVTHIQIYIYMHIYNSYTHN